ncbi:MAG: DUF3501 family protein [Candidatus Methylomirabilales bacterium]
MEKIRRNEILNLYEYEKIREEFRKRIIELKKRRRVQVGEKLSLLFENRDTVLFQIQEMIRTERIVDEGKIQEEVEVYNELIPDNGELSATLFIEIEEMAKIKEELDRFHGLDRPGTVQLRIGDRHVVPAHFEPGRSKEDKISAVHFIRFTFSPEQIRDFFSGEWDVSIIVDHPNYKAEVKLDPEVRQSLTEDLAEAAP